MLISQHGSKFCKRYARVAYYSVMAKTTSSSSFLHSPSKKGRSVLLMASTGIRVATIGTLWMVLTREARSSVSSSSLKSSKGLIFYIRFDLIIFFKFIINNSLVRFYLVHCMKIRLSKNKMSDAKYIFNMIVHM